MNTEHALSHYDIDDYLKNELLSDTKHEYINGDIYAMAVASKNHQRIIANLMRLLGNHLLNTPCEPFDSDIKLKLVI